MGQTQAKQFLAKMAGEEQLQAEIKAGYHQLLCDIARKSGFEFSVEELQQALTEEKCRLEDDTLDKVVGGRFPLYPNTNSIIY